MQAFPCLKIFYVLPSHGATFRKLMKKNLLCPNTSLDCVSVPGAGSQTHLLVCAWNSSSTYGCCQRGRECPADGFYQLALSSQPASHFQGWAGCSLPQIFPILPESYSSLNSVLNWNQSCHSGSKFRGFWKPCPPEYIQDTSQQRKGLALLMNSISLEWFPTTCPIGSGASVGGFLVICLFLFESVLCHWP